MPKTLKIVSSLIILALCMPLLVASLTEIGKYLGVRQVPVPVVGTGSMYPSLFWETGEGGPDDSQAQVIDEYRTTPKMYRRFPGVTLFGRTYLRRSINYGDMVTFESDKTRAILAGDGKDTNFGFIKRVVGLPGDKLELRDGYLIRNGQMIEEPYLYKPRSTYGDDFLSDCQVLTVPEDQYFVMGDNRKASADSRGKLGLVDDADINFLLPLRDQSAYQALWRDPGQDAALLGTPTLDSTEFYALVNAVREKYNLSSLKSEPKLVASAKIKAKSLLLGNSDLSLDTAMRQVGYHNIVKGELSIRGRFTAEELVNNILAFESTRAELLNPDFDDLGAYDLNQEVNACPTEVVVVHLGGYVPAEYSAEVVESWRNLSHNLKEVIPSWEEAKAYKEVDQTKLNELLAIYARRLALAEEILGVMERKEWLTEAQQAKINADESEAARANALGKELNQ